MRILIKCLIIIVLASSSMLLQGQEGLRPRGDVNCDWEISIADVNLMVESVLQGTQFHSFYTYALDVNGDMEITIADINMLIDAVLGNDLPPMASYSGSLPVLFINTEGYRNIVSKDKADYLHADWWLDAMGIEGYESIGSAKQPLGMQIKGCGNYTWQRFSKKPFRIKFDEKHSILGMPSNRNWVLLSNAEYWMGELNDAIPLEIGRRMGLKWNPRQVPVEVVLNGQYIGLYFLTEKIRVNKHRINITEQDDNEINPDFITGGWLLEIDNYYEPNTISLTEGNGNTLWITPHSPDTLSSIQLEYITSFLKEADDAIYNPDKESLAWEQYIDIDTIAIYYIIEEIVDNIESFSGSCYLHKERGENTKLIFGPHWDGGCCYVREDQNYQFNHFIYEEVTGRTPHWIAEIAKFPRFQNRVRFYWKKFYDEVYPAIDDYASTLTAQIEQAGIFNHLRWNYYSGDYVSVTFRYNKYFRKFFHEKVAWLNSQWGEPDGEITSADNGVIAVEAANKNSGAIATEGIPPLNK